MLHTPKKWSAIITRKRFITARLRITCPRQKGLFKNDVHIHCNILKGIFTVVGFMLHPCSR